MVTKSSVIVLAPRGAVVQPKAKPATVGLAIINNLLTADIVQAIVHADGFRLQVQEAERIHLELERAKPLHRQWLPNVVRAGVASSVLHRIAGVVGPRPTLTQADASAMLHYLFGAMGKRRGDEAAAKLMACIDVFSPASNALGPALGLWESTPTHPVILAIAIKQLMAAKTFEPAEVELREALEKVRHRIAVTAEWVCRWQRKLAEVDAMVFAGDHAAWDEAYANVDSDVVEAMREAVDDEGPGEDDDGSAVPASPYWQAFDDLAKAKLAAESVSARAAACKAKPTKRTRKLKSGRKDT